MKTGTANGIAGHRGAVVQVARAVLALNIAVRCPLLRNTDIVVKKPLRKETGGSVVARARKVTAAGTLAIIIALREWVPMPEKFAITERHNDQTIGEEMIE